jgi:RIO-like serine/threonine protein kinase
MAIVIRAPEDEEKKAYLSTVWKVAREKHSIRCGTLTKNVSIKIKNYELHLKKGDYIMFYDDKGGVVESLGIRLKEKGYNVLALDEFTIRLLLLSYGENSTVS